MTSKTIMPRDQKFHGMVRPRERTDSSVRIDIGEEPYVTRNIRAILFNLVVFGGILEPFVHGGALREEFARRHLGLKIPHADIDIVYNLNNVVMDNDRMGVATEQDVEQLLKNLERSHFRLRYFAGKKNPEIMTGLDSDGCEQKVITLRLMFDTYSSPIDLIGTTNFRENVERLATTGGDSVSSIAMSEGEDLFADKNFVTDFKKGIFRCYETGPERIRCSKQERFPRLQKRYATAGFKLTYKHDDPANSLRI